MIFKPILVFVQVIEIIFGNFLEAESNYQKPKRERNNIVNKGVWIRNNIYDINDRSKIGHFVFQESALDGETSLQNTFNVFDSNVMHDTPFVSDYVERQKRSSNSIRHNLLKENMNDKKSESSENNNSDKASLKLMNELRPTSVFNDYPYEVAIFLNNNKTYLDQIKNETIQKDIQKPNNNSNFSMNLNISSIFNDTDKNTMSQKRSMHSYDFESEVIKKIEYTEDLNKTDDNGLTADKTENILTDRKNDRNVFEKDNTEWHQNAPVPDVNVYKVVPKEPVQKSKPVTERGLIKVISMLTKSFKKIMRQHSEIKEINTKVNYIHDEITKTATTLNSKFQDFDLKYLYLVKLQEKLKEFETKMAAKDEYFKNKEIAIDKGLNEFENQQKKFLQQQKQFYNIQKLMLAQNEKINIKQNVIAKTQSEISHRQNNFARILKKAKQLYIDSRNPAITKLSSSIVKLKDPPRPHFEPKTPQTSTHSPEVTTGSIKINLFSIPTSNKVHQDPDEFILKDKDNQAIDDLVYKYYFNNTFIDNVMKNQILNSFLGDSENAGNVRSSKSKRAKIETTILLPVEGGNETEVTEHKRERRWTSHHNKQRHRRKNHRKQPLSVIINATDEVNISKHKTPIIESHTTPVKLAQVQDDPFLTMARSFCNEIGHNVNQQTLYWCIEKALRRLQILERKKPSAHIKANQTEKPETSNFKISKEKIHNTTVKVTKLNVSKQSSNKIHPHRANIEANPTTTTLSTTTAPLNTVTTLLLVTTDNAYTNLPNVKTIQDGPYFPDNEALELNLQQYDLKPDTEGNVYFDGSVHASALIADTESEGVDDIMPGLDSNSRVEVDPQAYDIQAKRRAIIRQLNERIKMSLG